MDCELNVSGCFTCSTCRQMAAQSTSVHSLSPVLVRWEVQGFSSQIYRLSPR